jgi:23S rRNA A1618 N6-methylase RlmF
MEMTMLEFAEAVLREIRKLQQQSEQIVLNGTIADMERYRFMMGRLEGLKMVEDSVKSLLKKVTDDDDLTT